MSPPFPGPSHPRRRARSRPIAATVMLLGVALACDLQPTGPDASMGGTLSAGAFHVCRVASAGATYCWGLNDAGQLGDSSFANRATPTLVAGRHTFAAVIAGAAHTCGFEIGGQLLCWGDNAAGRLGTSEPGPHTTPAMVAEAYAFSVVAAGGRHTCALTATGEPYCWGDNSSGQLGVRTLDAPCGRGSCSRQPVHVAGGLRFIAITAGGAHSCGVTADGATYCWGANGVGQLGTGTFTSTPEPALVLGQRRFAEVHAGGGYTCGRTRDGDLYCWGLGVSGQLGLRLPDSVCCSAEPVAVPGEKAWTTFAAGTEHACALDVSGHAVCWGDNTTGQIGDGTGGGSRPPTSVLGNIRFRAIVAGARVSCGIGVDGTTYCWGDNFRLELGNGGVGFRSTQPVPVLLPEAP